jgi:hypothetical protein
LQYSVELHVRELVDRLFWRIVQLLAIVTAVVLILLVAVMVIRGRRSAPGRV